MITYGISDVDTKALTGEATPRPVGAGDRIYSGYINLSAAVETRSPGLMMIAWPGFKFDGSTLNSLPRTSRVAYSGRILINA